jgi:hypothetical protein
VSLCVVVIFVVPHLSNVDVLPVTRKKLHEYILVSLVSPRGYFYSLLVSLLAYYLLDCLSLKVNLPSSTF